MSSKNAGKKGVSKDDLRRLMKQKKTEGNITHPLAKYNTLGHLICTVCNCQIKSDRLWNPHLMSRSHKENVSKPISDVNELKSVLDNKRKLESDLQAAKRLKEENTSKKPKGILKNAIPLAGYSSSSEDEEDKAPSSAHKSPANHGALNPSHTTSNNAAASTSASLPADFFDSGDLPDADTDVDKEQPGNPTEQLPEGFFDDPKADAKARKVEYIDKDVAEWEKFQSEIKQESEISEQIKAEDDTVITEDRHIEEIDEQLAQWGMVNNIIQKKEKLMGNKRDQNETTAEGDNSSEEDDPEYEQMIDWRSKKVIK